MTNVVTAETLEFARPHLEPEINQYLFKGTIIYSVTTEVDVSKGEEFRVLVGNEAHIPQPLSVMATGEIVSDALTKPTVTEGSVLEDAPASTKENPALDGEIKMSKNAMKKAAKAQRYQEFKLERRAREKQMQKEKKKIKAQKRAAGEVDESAEMEERARKKQKMCKFGGKVVLDLGFDDMMSEKEINSLCSQLAYTYSGNRNAGFPFSLLCTSVNGRTYDRLENTNDAAYKRWSHTEWWQEGYEKLWANLGTSASTSPEDSESRQNATSTSETDDEKRDESDRIKQSVVYLTADSNEELDELKPDEIYVIGAICDHNRYKNLTLNKANDQSIRHARLPIGKYISSLPTRKVLTVNQVFEIMLKWVETKDWEQAFYCIIPKRKFLGATKDPKENDSRNGSEKGKEDADVVVGEDQLLEQINGRPDGIVADTNVEAAATS